MRNKFLFFFLLILGVQFSVEAIVINVKRQIGPANQALFEAIKQAASYNGKPVTIYFDPGIYSFDRSLSIQRKYYISNTTSEKEDPDPTKHIAVLLDSLKNITIDGCGSTWLMTGEMTSFVLDHCENIVLKNINIDYSFPTQTEIEILEDGIDYLLVKVHPSSKYKIENGELLWYGDGWSFSKGITQWYDRIRNITWHAWNPMNMLKKVIEIRPNILYLQLDGKKENVKRGMILHMRDGIRDEVGGFINQSKNVRLENMNFYYLGNFGIVCQYSNNIDINHSKFMPKFGSGRTNAGFADFLQVSGCKGKIYIRNSIFSGSQDDPINIHGTHLKVVEYVDDRTLKVRFMHHQTYGFKAFFENDEIELVNAETLLPLLNAKVVNAELINPREMLLKLNKSVASIVRNNTQIVIENVTWTPEVLIQNNTFSCTPSRGILLSTRKLSVIENNTFYGTSKSAILIADDANSWYESGPVHQVIIRYNKFLQCNGPVIKIAPEYKCYQGPIHKNIKIESNIFESNKPDVLAVKACGVDNLLIYNNFIYMRRRKDFWDIQDCSHVSIEKNDSIFVN